MILKWFFRKNRELSNGLFLYIPKSGWTSMTDFCHRNNVIVNSFNKLQEWADFNVFDSNGIQRVNFIGRFENVQSDFNFIFGKIGLKNTLEHYNNS